MTSPYLPLLTKLGIRRQAAVDDATFLVYIDDLNAERFELQDVEVACTLLGKQPRGEFAAAFPSIGDLFKAIHEARSRRVSADAQQHARKIEAAADRRYDTPNMSTADVKQWVARLRRDVEARRRAKANGSGQ